MKPNFKNIPDALLTLTLLSFNVIIYTIEIYPNWQFWASLGSFLGFALMTYTEYISNKKIIAKPKNTKIIPDGLAIWTIVAFNLFVHRLFVSFLKWQFWFSLVAFLIIAIFTYVVYRFNKNNIGK